MPKTKAQKQNTISQIADSLEKQNSVAFVDIRGLNVGELARLRKQLKQSSAKLQVAKKTLLQRALKEKGIEMDVKDLEGEVAAVFAFEDPISPIKDIAAFAKTKEALQIRGGIIERIAYDAVSIARIATLPSKEQLQAQVVGLLASPMRGFASVLQGNLRGLAVALNAIKEQKESK